jgi:hypothetical protein
MEHDEAKEIFEAMNEQIVAELPQLLDLRIPYFDPSFEAMIRMQIKFAEEGYEKLGGVQRYAPVSSYTPRNSSHAEAPMVDTSPIAFVTIMQLVSWMPRYELRAHATVIGS